MSSGLHLLIDEEEAIPKTQEVGGVGVSLKELDANKLLSRQKVANFSHTSKDFPVLGKLRVMEDVEVKKKVLKGKAHAIQ
jgi:hypothetical protein